MNHRLDEYPQVLGAAVRRHGFALDTDPQAGGARVRQGDVQSEDLLVTARGQGSVAVPRFLGRLQDRTGVRDRFVSALKSGGGAQ